MLLYHGSYTIVTHPQLLKNQRVHNFGDAFYLTTDKEQAKKWARIVTNRISKYQTNATPTVNIYNIDIKNLRNLKIKVFKNKDKEWLNFITKNRIYGSQKLNYDIIIGPVADASPGPILKKYAESKISYIIAIKYLKANRLTNQFAFKSEKAIKLLIFRGEEHA